MAHYLPKAVGKVPKAWAKGVQQCAGFLRVPESKDILDNTAVHPDPMAQQRSLLSLMGYSLEDVRQENWAIFQRSLQRYDKEKAAKELGIGVPHSDGCGQW